MILNFEKHRGKISSFFVENMMSTYHADKMDELVRVPIGSTAFVFSPNKIPEIIWNVSEKGYRHRFAHVAWSVSKVIDFI
mmetsp:Transcript_29075/g.44978  ORF Transcript_29075/g.44978 Transcript_29075/m.44978 type:complete len:80 (-) Transcript_29075:705-944(-)